MWIIYAHLLVLFSTSTIMVNVFEDMKIRYLFVATAGFSVMFAFVYACYSLMQIWG